MYDKYIKLGFKRIDIKDNVDFRNTGYHGFILAYELNKSATIEVCYGNLDNPKLYIKKPKSESLHILKLTIEQVAELVK
jgi:hypothetical protein